MTDGNKNLCEAAATRQVPSQEPHCRVHTWGSCRMGACKSGSRGLNSARLTLTAHYPTVLCRSPDPEGHPSLGQAGKVLRPLDSSVGFAWAGREAQGSVNAQSFEVGFPEHRGFRDGLVGAPGHRLEQKVACMSCSWGWQC